MLRFFLIAGTVVFSTSAAVSQEDECIDFGLNNTYLQAHFCAEFKSLGQESLGTRSVQAGDDNNQSSGNVPKYAELPVIRDAFRADPSATLELIKRIKNAGGLGDH